MGAFFEAVAGHQGDCEGGGQVEHLGVLMFMRVECFILHVHDVVEFMRVLHVDLHVIMLCSFCFQMLAAPGMLHATGIEASMRRLLMDRVFEFIVQLV